MHENELDREEEKGPKFYYVDPSLRRESSAILCPQPVTVVLNFNSVLVREAM